MSYHWTIPLHATAALMASTGISDAQVARSARWNERAADYYGFTTTPMYQSPADPQLARDVATWQRDQGLTADGAIGENTINKMHEQLVFASFAGFPDGHPGSAVQGAFFGGPFSPPYEDPRPGNPNNPNAPISGGGGGRGGSDVVPPVVIPPAPSGTNNTAILIGVGLLVVGLMMTGKKKKR